MSLGLLIAIIIGGLCAAGVVGFLWHALQNFTRKGWEYDAGSGVFMLVFAAMALVGLLATIAIYRHESGETFELLKSEWACSASHDQTDLVPTKVGDVMVMMPTTSTVCDAYQRR